MTVLEIIQGTIINKYKYVHDRVARPDVIAQISEANIVLSKEKKIKQFFTEDGNTHTNTDSKGATNGSDLASTDDRNYVEHEYTLPERSKIGIVITPDDAVDYGIDIDKIDKNTLTGKQAVAVVGALKDEIDTLIRKTYQRRYDQVIEMFVAFRTPGTLPDNLKPYGFAPIDFDINRPTNFTYTNRITGLLSTATKGIAVDISASEQLNAWNQPVGRDELRVILHASSYTLAEDVHLKSQSMKMPVFSPGDSYAKNFSVGVYKDLINRDDWIWLTPMSKIVRRGRRRFSSQLESGIEVNVYVSRGDSKHPVSGLSIGSGSLVVEVYDDTIMCIDSINGIGMSIN